MTTETPYHKAWAHLNSATNLTLDAAVRMAAAKATINYCYELVAEIEKAEREE